MTRALFVLILGATAPALAQGASSMDWSVALHVDGRNARTAALADDSGQVEIPGTVMRCHYRRSDGEARVRCGDVELALECGARDVLSAVEPVPGGRLALHCDGGELPIDAATRACMVRGDADCVVRRVTAILPARRSREVWWALRDARWARLRGVRRPLASGPPTLGLPFAAVLELAATRSELARHFETCGGVPACVIRVIEGYSTADLDPRALAALADAYRTTGDAARADEADRLAEELTAAHRTQLGERSLLERPWGRELRYAPRSEP